MKSENTLRPGEQLFAVLMVIFAGYAFWESFGISGFTGLTTGGVMPMLASGVMIITSCVILAGTLRNPRSSGGSVGSLIVYLFPLRVVFFALLVFAYVAVIPSAGFLPASGGLLFVAIWVLWRKGPIWSFAISVGATGATYLVFRVVFQVVLPVGSLWQ